MSAVTAPSIQSFSSLSICPGGELCDCPQGCLRRLGQPTTAHSCRVLPQPPLPAVRVEPEPASASLLLAHKQRSTHAPPTRTRTAMSPRKLSTSSAASAFSWARKISRGDFAQTTPSASARGCWATGVLSVAHAAVRAECAHLRTLVASVRARAPNRVQDHEVDELARWWGRFARFVDAALGAEERVVEPWARERSPPDALASERLADTRAAAIDAVSAVEATLDLRRHVDREDVLAVFVSDAPVASSRLLEYCAEAAAALVPCIKATRAPAEAAPLARRAVSAVRVGSDPGMNVAVLAEWMHPALREKWVRSHLRGVNRMLYPRWARRYHRDHAVVPLAFQQRLDAAKMPRRGASRGKTPRRFQTSPVTPERVQSSVSKLYSPPDGRSTPERYNSSGTSSLESHHSDSVKRMLLL